MRRPVLPIQPRAARVSTNPFAFSQFRTLFYPERSRGVRPRSISFVFKSLRTLLRNGALPSPLLSMACALFPMQWGVRVHGHQGTSNLPYNLPSSVCSKSCVFTLFKKLPGCRGFLPILEPSPSAFSYANVFLTTFVPHPSRAFCGLRAGILGFAWNL